MALVGSIGRAVIRAAPGHRLLCADFSGIESRVTAWLSGQQSKVDQWAHFDATGDKKEEPYYILGKRLGQPEESARKIGKTADLAFGYMGSVGAWQKLAPDDTSSDEQIQQYKQGWRNEHMQTVRFWRMLDRAAVRAIEMPGQVIACGRVSFSYDGDFLRMRLPSGRDLAYPQPRLHTNERGDVVVIFKDNAKGKFTDCRHGHGAYGGTWIENAVQAVARDLFAAALLRLEAANYPVVLHVHDEIVAEAPIGVGSIEEFHQIMIAPPDWAAGLPIAAASRNGERFAKIEAPRAAEPAPAQQACADTAPEPEILQQNGQPPPWEGAEEEPVRFKSQHEQPRPGNGHFNGYPHGEREGGRIVSAFIYLAADGSPYLQVRKFEVIENGERRKSFPQYHQESGRWVKGKPAGPRIPYRLPELLAAPPDAWIDVMEGEKDADCGAELGLITTTNPEGAGKWREDLNEHFHGRRVRVHEDNDDAGRRHAAKVVDMLRGVAKEITIVQYPELDAGGDFSDFMYAGGTITAMKSRAKPADDETRAAPGLGEWDAGDDTELPPPRGWLLGNIFARKFMSSLLADGGVGKTALRYAQLLSLAAGRSLTGDHVFQRCRVLIVSLEDDADELRRRILALMLHYGIDRSEVKGWLFLSAPGAARRQTDGRRQNRPTYPRSIGRQPGGRHHRAWASTLSVLTRS